MRISDWSSDVCSSDLAPYERSFSYVFDETVDDYVNNLRAAGQNARIVFSELNEDVYAGAIDLGYKLPTSMSISLHGGYAYTSTKRDASRREFRFVPAADRKSTRLNSSH